MLILYFLTFLFYLVDGSSLPPPFHCDTPDHWFQEATRGFHVGRLWDNGVVKYELHSSLNANDRVEVQKAFAEYESKTCIRFLPRSPGEVSYTVIQRDNNVCGVAHVCRTGGAQYAKFGGGCAQASTMIHELGHNLCLGHEQLRPDRDNFLQFDRCRPNEIPAKYADTHILRGHFYDYTSRMHYQCGWCPGGWPKMEGITRCGSDVQQGLSVMDVDKVNDMYGCGGCLRHRWRRYENFTDADRQSMPYFGQTPEPESRPLHLCRTYVNGEMTPGKYRFDQNVCYVGSRGVEHRRSQEVQVYTIPIPQIPRGAKKHEDGVYTLFPVTSTTSARSYNQNNFIPIGSTPTGVTIYGVTATIRLNGMTERSVGKLYANNMTHALIPFWGAEHAVTEFAIIGCK